MTLSPLVDSAPTTEVDRLEPAIAQVEDEIAPRAKMIGATDSRVLVEQLRRSDIYRAYADAFRETTGLPLALRPVEAFDLPHHGDPKENPFCEMMAGSNHTCAACLRLQRELIDAAVEEAQTRSCFAGLKDSAVPVRVGERLVAFLQTGQILHRGPRPSDLTKTMKRVVSLKEGGDAEALRVAYSRSRVITKTQYDSILRLLSIFAQHLSALSNQLLVQGEKSESPAIARAREYITENHAEELTLGDVAHKVNMSAFYFCKTFKKSTGLTFTDYLARVRVEKVKELLLDPHKRVSEAAYEVGFQSLSQFNRVFHRITGESPTAYRDRLKSAVRRHARAERAFFALPKVG